MLILIVNIRIKLCFFTAWTSSLPEVIKVLKTEFSTFLNMFFDLSINTFSISELHFICRLLLLSYCTNLIMSLGPELIYLSHTLALEISPKTLHFNGCFCLQCFIKVHSMDQRSLHILCIMILIYSGHKANYTCKRHFNSSLTGDDTRSVYGQCRSRSDCTECAV